MAELVAARYELVREVGKGASAAVYRAYDRTLDRYIAIKLVSPALANDPDFVDRFFREARLAAGLQHPNIVTVHDVGETDDGRPFLAMALIEGVNLEEVIRESAPLPEGEALRILGELTSALEYLHGQGLVHRDVKPSNILVEETGRVVLSDFGIAYARESARYTNTGVLLGTPRYMAPEQFQDNPPTTATDVYAMGVIAFELLSGAAPFEGSGTALMYRIVHEPPPALTSLAPEVSPGIETVIAKALAKDAAERWTTPAEFLAALQHPDANATMLGPVSGMAGTAAAGTPARAADIAESPEAPPPSIATVVPPEMGPDTGVPTPAMAAVENSGHVQQGGRGGGGRSGRAKALAGVLGAGVIGFGLAGYCLAAGGFLPAADDDDEPTPTAEANAEPTDDGDAAQTAAPGPPLPTKGGTGSPSSTPRAQSTTSAPPVSTVIPPTATSVPPPGPTQPDPPEPTATNPPQPSATNTSVPPPANTPTPSPGPLPPQPPSNVSLNGNTLTWSDNSNDETGFHIHWRARNINTGEYAMGSDRTVGPDTMTTTVDPVNLTGVFSDFGRGVSAYNAVGESAIAWE